MFEIDNRRPHHSSATQTEGSDANDNIHPPLTPRSSGLRGQITAPRRSKTTPSPIDKRPNKAVAIGGSGNGPVPAARPKTTDMIASAMMKSLSISDDGQVPSGMFLPEPSSLSSATPAAERPLNPDLPTRNVLFVFDNFASYMRAPNEGSDDVSEASLKDAQRLLEHARELRENPRNRVNVLHIKYRFPVISLQNEANRTAPPFATLMDPVIKLDYKQTGGYEPSQGAAILRHMSKHIDPLPRAVVYSYIASRKTAGHLNNFSILCESRRVPITVLSPTETRIREALRLEVALGKAVDIPMYANVPSQCNPLGNSLKISHSTGSAFWPAGPTASGGSYMQAKELALQQHGVASSSYLSIRNSWNSSREVAGKVKVTRLKEYEALVDTLDLGDDPSEELPMRHDDSLLPGDRVYARKRSAFSSNSSTSRSREGSSHRVRKSEVVPGTMLWRNMVVAHADPLNPEYVAGNMS